MPLPRANLPRDQDTALIFIDESGSISNDRYFAVGCLKLTDPAKTLRAMQTLRDRRKFYGELHFSQVTKGTAPFYREVVDLLASSGESFSCFVADRTAADPVVRFGTSWAAYEKLATQLVIAAVRPAEIVTVLADNYSTPAQYSFEASVKRQVNRRLRRLAVLEVCRLDSKSADPLQLVDLLTSAVAFEYRQAAGVGSATSPKGLLAKYVRDSFGVSTCMGGCLGQTVSVREYEHSRWASRRSRAGQSTT
jgi:hypothetical protein